MFVMLSCNDRLFFSVLYNTFFGHWSRAWALFKRSPEREQKKSKKEEMHQYAYDDWFNIPCNGIFSLPRNNLRRRPAVESASLIAIFLTCEPLGFPDESGAIYRTSSRLIDAHVKYRSRSSEMGLEAGRGLASSALDRIREGNFAPGNGNPGAVRFGICMGWVI